MKDKIVVANASGFWGDEADAIRRQVLGGHIDYLTMDYLAEITMIILGRQLVKDPEAGYARDFVSSLAGVIKEIADRNITVVTNAGGINAKACAKAIEKIVTENGLDLPVAAIYGDNLMPGLEKLKTEGVDFPHLETGQPIGDLFDNIESANAYLGAKPIVAALKKGARIIVTGRTYDAASVVAPFVYEFGWDWEEYDKLASALLAGHLIECGAQSTGGNYSRWQEIASYKNMGFPMVEAYPDGSFILKKHPNTGGKISARTAKEQVVYEISDPRVYRSPDVVADFSTFTLEEIGEDQVRFFGTKGQKPSNKLKVSTNYAAGFKLIGMLVVSGPDAVAKGKIFADMFWDRVGMDGFTDRRTDFVGASACWGESVVSGFDPPEILLRFAARAETKEPLKRMSKELAGLILSGPPGVTVFGGRPAIVQAYGFWPALIAREKLQARMLINGEESIFECDDGPCGEPVVREFPNINVDSRSGKKINVPLGRIAHARSGDKGDLANIGVIALRPELYPEIIREVTIQRIADFFKSNVTGPIEVYRLDNICALNFVLHGALNGGGTVSLLLDNQGKTLSQALLTMIISVTQDLLPEPEGVYGYHSFSQEHQ